MTTAQTLRAGRGAARDREVVRARASRWTSASIGRGMAANSASRRIATPHRRRRPILQNTACYKPPPHGRQSAVSSDVRAAAGTKRMKKGFYTIMSAQFFSSLADNALLVAAIELLEPAARRVARRRR